MANTTEGGEESAVVSFDNLYSAILQCFVVILSGYIAGRIGHVTTSQGRGIAAFISTFCLPALLFRSMCSLDFSQVNWLFLLSILIAKVTVFILVAVITLLVKRPVNFGYSGLFAIFCTQSNDFALGYPILQALYQNSHPEFLNYVYLIAPISMLILNPVGFTLMEINRQQNHHSAVTTSDSLEIEKSREEHQDSIHSGNTAKLRKDHHNDKTRSKKRVWLKGLVAVIKGVLLNPIVFMSVIGIAGNFIFHHTVPAILDDILVVLGNAFSASALFYLGLSMVGKVKSQIGLVLVVPVLLISAKSLLLPLITWEVVSWLQPNETESRALSMFGFLYGTFPSAPSVLLYATQYGVANQAVATGMVAGTFLSAPLMFVSAKMMTMVVSHDVDHHSLLLSTCTGASIISIVCCVWVTACLLLSGRWKRIPHRFTLCYIVSHVLACIGRLTLEDMDHAEWQNYIQWIVLMVGIFASRCWTAALALALCLLHTRSLCFVLKHQIWFHFLGFGFPILMTGLMLLLGSEDVLKQYNPSCHLSIAQKVISAIVLTTSLIISLVSMVVWQRTVWHSPTDPRYTPITSSPPMTENDHQATTVMEKNENGDGINSRSPLTSPSRPQHDYEACASSSICRLASDDIEDVVPFPESSNNSGCDAVVQRAYGEDSRMEGSSGSASLDERTCLLNHCNTPERKACQQRLRRYIIHLESSADSPQDEGTQDTKELFKEEYQSVHHLLLLLLLTVSVCMGLFLCIWRIFSDQVSGTYLEIEFLDSVFNYGQGVLIFVVFGFDVRMAFTPVVRRIRRWMYGAEEVHLPDLSELDEETTTTCQQFLTFHILTCRNQICRDGRFRLRRYRSVFTGAELTNWLMGAGLANDKEEAVTYGRRLLAGRIIEHVTGLHHFEHGPLFYNFVNIADADR